VQGYSLGLLKQWPFLKRVLNLSKGGKLCGAVLTFFWELSCLVHKNVRTGMILLLKKFRFQILDQGRFSQKKCSLLIDCQLLVFKYQMGIYN
jgi:hypothetical protein